MSQQYTDQSIQIFEGVKAVRQRPAMYIGSTDEVGFHHLGWEIIDNALDEYLAHHCNTIRVTLKTDGAMVVEDNGRGIPVGIHPKTGLSTIETVYTYLHAGGKFSSQTYQVSGGLHGVGSTVVNAMSEYLKVEVFRNGNIYTLEFKNGKKITPSVQIALNPQPKKTGTRIEFRPNLKLFDDYYEFKTERVLKRLEETALINDKVKIIFTDERASIQKTLYYKKGIQDYLKKLVNKITQTENQHETPIFDLVTLDKITVKFIFRYTNALDPTLLSFCNNIRTIEGGSHEKGFRLAIGQTSKRLMKKFKYYDEKKDSVESKDGMAGVVGILVVLHPDPKFTGQTKTKLVNAETSSIVYQAVSKTWEKFLLENPQERELVFRKILHSSRLRKEIAKKIREVKDKNKYLTNATLPGKLADCASRNSAQSELYIVEGDSAGGSAKLGRDRHFQAILPLKGKIINSEKATTQKLLANQEVSDLIISLGLKNSDVKSINDILDTNNSIETQKQNSITQLETLKNKLRYHKIIIMTDADVDGSHIAVLLLTFLYRWIPGLIENKFVYLAQPPLFKLTIGKRKKYLYSESELAKEVANIQTKYSIQRYKGLGEMNPGQLWETTMNPENRTLKLITIEDAKQANDTITLLMGKEVEGRKEFIVKNAKFAANIDI